MQALINHEKLTAHERGIRLMDTNGHDGENSNKRLERQYADAIYLLAKKLSEEMDLSPETARALSVGYPYLRGLTPFGKKGRCHTGGAKRNGTVATDRYTGYRMKDLRFTLALVRHFSDPESEFRFIVEAPKHLLPEPSPLMDLRKVAHPNQKRFLDAFGMRFSEFEQAAGLYEKLIRENAPKKQQAI